MTFFRPAVFVAMFESLYFNNTGAIVFTMSFARHADQRVIRDWLYRGEELWTALRFPEHLLCIAQCSWSGSYMI